MTYNKPKDASSCCWGPLQTWQSRYRRWRNEANILWYTCISFLKPKESIQVIYYCYYHYHYYLFLVSQFLLPEVWQATSFLGSGLGGRCYLVGGREHLSWNLGCAQQVDLLEVLNIDVSRNFFDNFFQRIFPGPFYLGQVLQSLAGTVSVPRPHVLEILISKSLLSSSSSLLLFCEL